MPVSPIYVFLAVAVALLCVPYRQKLKQAVVKAPKLRVVSAIATLHFALYLIWVGPANSAIGFYFNFLFLTLVWLVLPFATRSDIQAAMSRMIDLTTGLAIVEAAVRWLFPFQEYTDKFLNYVDESGATFYLYKFNSIMYQDSNFVAMWLLVVLVMTIEHFGWKQKKLQISLMTCLLVLTICRSAILFFMAYVALRHISAIVRSKFLRFIIFVTVAAGALAAIWGLVIHDDSFQSKITIFSLVTSNYLLNASATQIFLGLGLSNSAELLDGIAAHNYVIEVMMDTGVMGLAYTLYSMFHLANISGRAGYSVVWLFLLAGLSFAPITTPYLFIILSMLAAANILNYRKAQSARANNLTAA